jgi:hypothetical protein
LCKCYSTALHSLTSPRKSGLNGVLVIFAVSLVLNFIYEPSDAKSRKKSDSAEADKDENQASEARGDGLPSVEGVTDGDDEAELGADEIEGTFIPISWYKEAPLEFYKASDPEYQEFVKFNKNGNKQAHVILWLNTCIRKFAEINYEEFVGKVDLGAGRYWTDIIYPDGPPPGMYQTG